MGITAAAAAAALTVAPATAGSVSDPIAEGLSSPLQFSFDSNGRPLVAQAFGPGTISRVTKAGDLVDVVQDDGSITGVATRGKKIAYTLAGGLPPDVARDDASLQGGVEGFTVLKVQDAAGEQRVVADLGRAEANRNPDAHQVYGWLDYNQACGTDAPEGQTPRGGIVESNPYAVAAAPGGGWYVADAATNAIWKAKAGKLRVVSVLKPRTATVTQDMVDDQGLDQCTVGTRYNYEPVPTDVEVGPDGRLYVSLLPGEGNAEGAPRASGMGAVVRINPVTGRTQTVANGFDSATNVALAGDKVYVAELFAGQVSQINMRTGNVRPIVYMQGPAALERNDGTLYVTSLFTETLSIIDPTGPTQVP